MIENLIKYKDAKETGPWQEITEDILLIPFWKEDFCSEVIEACELLDEFKEYEKDLKDGAAPGKETRLNRISPRFVEAFENDIQERIVPIIQKHWWPLGIGPVRMPFVLRYSPDTQASLDPHHDAALVSMTMPLNEEYLGGHLTFPRQHWDTRDVPIGHFVVFPSQVTHVHWVTPVLDGTRYAMTCWISWPKSNPHDAILRR